MKTIYIAGRMRGITLYNYLAFYKAERELTAEGWRTINPARITEEIYNFHPELLPDDHDWSTWPPGVDQAETVFADLKEIYDADAIYMLTGWQEGLGACAEHAFAKWIGKEIIYETR